MELIPILRQTARGLYRYNLLVIDPAAAEGTDRQARDYLPNRRAPPPFGRYQSILLGNREWTI